MIGIHTITEIKSWSKLYCEWREAQRVKLTKMLLPRGYPENYPNDFLTFTKYTFIANVCFNVMNFISTQVLINSLGLGISKSTGYAFSAGMNYVIKEGFGQAGK